MAGNDHDDTDRGRRMQQVQNGVVQAAQEEADAYRDGETRPLGGYVVIMAVFGALLSGAAGLALATGRKLPPGVGPWDLLLIAAGTHKLSRTLSKDAVTSPLRAPFTRYKDTGGPAEVMEEVRHYDGLRHSIGELITCPFCLDVWIAAGFTIGLVFAPRLTRLVAATLSAVTGADFLHLLYAKAQSRELIRTGGPGGAGRPHPHHDQRRDLGERQPALEQSQRHELPPRHARQRAQHEAQQDRHQPPQRGDAEPPRRPRERTPARVATPRPAQRQGRGGQAEERQQAGVAVDVARRRRADRPVDLLEGDDDHEARAPRRQQRHRRAAQGHEAGPDQAGQHRNGPGRDGEHPGVEHRLPRAQGVLAERAPERVDLLQGDHVQREHRDDAARDQRGARKSPGTGAGGAGRGGRGHGRLQGRG